MTSTRSRSCWSCGSGSCRAVLGASTSMGAVVTFCKAVGDVGAVVGRRAVGALEVGSCGNGIGAVNVKQL